MKDKISTSVIQGDITKIQADAIVNAANTSLLGGGGVDGAIHRAGGPEILEACRVIRNRQGGCPVGEAVITTAGRLPASYVIHTVGPVWRDGLHGEAALLGSAYRHCLQLAKDYGLRSIAFPNISTGIYHFPKDEAARIALETTQAFVKTADALALTSILFVCFDAENYRIYQELLAAK